ncbi:hypothetical protein MBLNU457_7724t2 [Dothideomycetes sp. NU457]
MTKTHDAGFRNRNPRRACAQRNNGRRAPMSQAAQAAQRCAYTDEIVRLWAQGGFEALPGKPLDDSITNNLRRLVFFNLACACLFVIALCYLTIRTWFYPEIDYTAMLAVVVFYAAPRWFVNPIWVRIFMPDVELMIDLP